MAAATGGVRPLPVGGVGAYAPALAAGTAHGAAQMAVEVRPPAEGDAVGP